MYSTHESLHSDHGARSGEHPGRAADPIIKVRDLAWLELEKPDLRATERFAHAFGLVTALRTEQELHLRGTDPQAPCLLVRKGPRSRFLGPAFVADDVSDLSRLAAATGAAVAALPESLGGVGVELRDPAGNPVRVVADVAALPRLPGQPCLTVNAGDATPRVNSAQRPARAPASVQRLGHVVLQTSRFVETLDWHLAHLGLIVSDFQYFEGQRERGPVMAFIRCDRGRTPTDHHTLAMALGPSDRYVHSAYQVADLDALAAGGEYLREAGYRRSWGIGRHIQGSQIFDYWRDPDGLLVEHFTDGDMFDDTLAPGWAPMKASGLAQWGPPASRDFLGLTPGRESAHELRALLGALRRNDTEFDLNRLRGLLKVATS